MTDDSKDKVVTEVMGDDEFVEAQKNLSSEYKRNKYIQEHFKYVPPIEIVLNKEEVSRGEAKEVIHYVPVTQSFKHLLEDKSFNDLLENERNNLDKADKDVLRDFTDGSAFKQNKYLSLIQVLMLPTFIRMQ